MHAITDALLGAAALGDIGELYPDTDPANRNRDSGEMLRAAREKVAAAGWEIVNIDCIVFAQRPRLSPHREAMQNRLAEVLGVEPGQIGVKAKSGEQVGAIGREEALIAEAVVLLERAAP